MRDGYLPREDLVGCRWIRTSCIRLDCIILTDVADLEDQMREIPLS